MKKLLFGLALAACMGLLGGCLADQEQGGTMPPRESSAPPVQSTAATEWTAEPTAEPTTEPATVPETQPASEPMTEPITQPATEPVTEPATTPATEPVTEAATEQISEPAALQYRDMKGIWLSQYDLTRVYLDGNVQRDEGDFTALMARILDNVKAQGFNTVFLQVRPNADSMYPSRYYPMSAYVVGQIGGAAQYDPVAVIVRLAHERALSIHAWINPMRGMTETEIKLVGQDYLIRRWFEDPQRLGKYIVLVNGRWYLNPAYGEVADLICAGAEEVLRLYGFDGLHMDDYFYPATDPSFDAAAYAEYRSGGGTLELADFRRNALNALVSRLHALTRNSGSGKIFGISPAGNVDTVYHTQYADVYRWCGEDGYIDYICPQAYFGLEHGSHDFVKVCRMYQDMIQADSVDLIIGMTFGKAFTGEDQWAGSGRDEWKDHKDVLARCLGTTLELEDCRGVAVFSYQYFFDPVTGQSVAETAEERDNFVPVFREITWD